MTKQDAPTTTDADSQCRAEFEAHWRKVRGSERAATELRSYPADPKVYINDSANHHFVTWQAARASSAAAQPRTGEMADAYSLIDRFLRNNLDDADYAEHSAALDRVTACASGSAVQWRPLIEAPFDDIVLVAAEFDGPGDWRIKCGYLDKQTSQWRVFGSSWEPTHWMPLPAPPAKPADTGEAPDA